MNHKRQLIIVADDFGISLSVSRGIVESFQNGIVRATSIMANSPYLKPCMNLLEGVKNLDLGIHFTLTWGKPLLSPEKIPSLVDKNGFFFKSPIFFRKALFNHINQNEVYRELTAQLDCLGSYRLKLIHADSHQHVHILPVIRKVVTQLAAEYKIPFVRSLSNNRFYMEEGPWHRGLFMGGFLGSQSSYWKKNGFKTADHFAGYFTGGISGLMDRWVNYLRKLPEGTTELMVHPGYMDDLEGDSYREGRVEEIKVLCSDELKEVIKKNQISLVRFEELDLEKPLLH